MPTILAGYEDVVAGLEETLAGLPGMIVGIDGRDGVGKTTLGRYLAWHFNISLVETDLFLDGTKESGYDLDRLRSVIERRLAMPRPVLVDGICLLELFKHLGKASDVLVHVWNTQHPGSDALAARLDAYEDRYEPAAVAQYEVVLDDCGS